uniref:LSM family member 14B n=1 Tax=Labrus bergylta TaxID=56723 RepID=A0A3Q3ESF4_9LABR
MPAYNQLAASSLLNQQYAAALGLGKSINSDGPHGGKSVQTLHVDGSRQRRALTTSHEQEQRPRRRRNRSRGQLMVADAPSAILKFEEDFDFDSSNARFMKEQLEKEDKRNEKDGDHQVEEKEKEALHLTTHDDHFGPKCYYDKAKSFFDNISSDKKFRLTWAEERKRNLETFGVPGRFLRGQGFRGGYSGRRGWGASQSAYRTAGGRL